MSRNPAHPQARRAEAVARLMNPRSIAIVGMSSKPGTVAHQVLRNLLVNDFAGRIQLVGRSGGQIEGHDILTDLHAIEEGTDVAVLTLPAAGVEDALEACIARRVGIAVVFASGFAELGADARAAQDRLRDRVRAAGLPVIGPNCLGYTNYTQGLNIGFVTVLKVPRTPSGTRGAVAIVGQSGSVQSHLAGSLLARGVDVSYSISTGNQMDLGFGDFIQHLLHDEATSVVAVYAEHIEQAEPFLEAAREARRVGKAIVMLHPGRSEKAQAATRSHTGALASNHAVMRAVAEAEGVLVVDTLDEFLDLSELLARYPQGGVQGGGLGLATLSGAFCGIAQDFCDALDIPMPPLSPATVEKLRASLPAYATPNNPLDLGTQPVFQHELMYAGVEGLLSEPGIGGVVVSMPPSSAANGMGFLQNILRAKAEVDKPLIVSVLYDSQPLPEPFLALAREHKLVLSRSSDRSLRAMARLLQRSRAAAQGQPAPGALPALPASASGTLPEWQGKQLLASAGIATPAGELARDLDSARAVAARIGYPVALKAQAAALAHKTEAGGVLLNLADEAALVQGWERLHANVRRASPGLQLDGVLVEKMAAKGVELVVGARRDPQWGSTLLVGLGGVLVEALRDVRLLTPGLSEAQILGELQRLRAARVLQGFRDLPALDLGAAVSAIRAVDRLMAAHPSIVEIDVNPLMLHAQGQGATALDALIVRA